LLYGAAILLVPVAQAWRERRRVWVALLAATGSILLIGLGLMLYNARRFDSPFEFGVRYLLAGERQVTQQSFSLRYLWFNFRVYFLEPARWSPRFPFVRKAVSPPFPPGHGNVEGPYGILTNVPLAWLALAVPLAWRSRSGLTASTLRWFVMAVALLFGMLALTLGLYCGACFRYEVDILPALLLLATIGILGLEQALSDQPTLRRIARWCWGVLLGFSVMFNLLASVEYHAEAHHIQGVTLFQAGRVSEAIGQFKQALHLYPDYTKAHLNLGIALGQMGRVQEAVEHYQQALRINPDDAEARSALARLQASH
jgi:hypothetical protein